MYTELEELLGFYKKELLSTKGKKYCQSSQKSNIDQVEDNFHALVTVLVMSIFVQFHRKDNKKYFAEDQLYSKDIVDIKQYLEGMINERVLRELLIQQVCIEKSLTLLNKNNIIRNQNISELGLYQELKFDHEWNGHNNRWSVICNVYEFDMKNNHHSRLLDLLNILNTIDFLYKGLIESCLKDDGSESVYTSKIVLLLKGKEDLSKLDTNLLIE